MGQNLDFEDLKSVAQNIDPNLAQQIKEASKPKEMSQEEITSEWNRLARFMQENT